MKEFKFLQKEQYRTLDNEWYETYQPYILPYQRTEETNRYNIIHEGWNAHRNNLPPGQCPYDIGTQERVLWLDGWSSRENGGPTPQPIENELYIQVEDIDTGEHFGIPHQMNCEISYRARVIFFEGRTSSGRCGYHPYEYFIDNVYRSITTEDRLVIDVGISVPYNGSFIYHRIRQIIPYE